MKCPYCAAEQTKVLDTRETEELSTNRRRRECEKCSKRFTTYERIELPKEVTQILQVRKKDNSIVLFSQSRILEVISSAANSTGKTDKALHKQLADEVITKLQETYSTETTLDVDQIQDMIEQVLIAQGHADIAKAYILSRYQSEQRKRAISTFVKVHDAMNEYLSQADWRVKENSNENYSFSGLRQHVAGKIIANYALSEIYTPSIAEAHRAGYLHIHDLGSTSVGYCAGWSLKQLFLKGLAGVSNKVNCKPAKHMDTAVDHIINFIGCLQMEFAGAQAFSSIDTFLAPFVRKDNLPYEKVKQNIQRLIYHLNIPSRWGCQTPFTNFTFDLNCPEDVRTQKAIVGGAEQDFTYGECQKEMDMINNAFLENMRDGDASGRIFTFPIPTYNLTKDFDWNSEVANLLFEVTAKYGLPYFQNYIGSDLDPKSVRAMCCRLNLDLNELRNKGNGLFGAGELTGSIGVVTINVNRMAYESRTKEEFFKRLKYYMLLAKESLEIKRKHIELNLQQGLMPFSKEYLGTFANHFSTIGMVGMNEACLNLLGQNIATHEGKEFAVETLKFMREIVREFQLETGHLYNLEATPAEGCSYRLAKLDKKFYPDILTSGVDAPFLTNSTCLPVDFTTNAITAIAHQTDLQALYSGGTVFHTFLGERLSSSETCKNLVRKISYNTKLPYFTITPTFSICKDHGYIVGEKPSCPTCSQATEVYSRVTGYFRPVSAWNTGKREEFKRRLVYKEDVTLGTKFHQELTEPEYQAFTKGQVTMKAFGNS